MTRAQAPERRARVRYDGGRPDGLYQPSMKARTTEVEQQKAPDRGARREAPLELPDVIPNVAEVYRARVQHLAEALADPQAPGGRRGYPLPHRQRAVYLRGRSEGRSTRSARRAYGDP